jgi:CRISP-associated protein Cas1
VDQGLTLTADGKAWADRSAFWLKKSASKFRQFERRAGVRQPLILSGHGVKLRVDRGSLLAQNGFTHYPQQRETWRFFAGDWRLPSRIVVLDVDGGLTFDAISWLSTHDVPLVQINWRGEVVNIVGANVNGTIPEQVKSQLIRAKHGGPQFAHRLIRNKIANSIETLQHAFPNSAAIDFAIEKLETELALLKRDPPSSISQLMGIEGRVG